MGLTLVVGAEDLPTFRGPRTFKPVINYWAERFSCKMPLAFFTSDLFSVGVLSSLTPNGTNKKSPSCDGRSYWSGWEDLPTFCGPEISSLKTSFQEKVSLRKSTGLSHLTVQVFSRPENKIKSLFFRIDFLFWSGWEDLNLRPHGPKPRTLANWATPR